MNEIEKILNELKEITSTKHFLEYVALRNKGLKKDAQKELEFFIIDFISQNKDIQRHCINLICKIAFLSNRYDLYLPYNLYNKVFVPGLKNWIADDPKNAIPYKWINDWEQNKKSIELDSTDEIAIEKFSNQVIGRVSMNQHELTAGYSYDGDPIEDLSLINYVQKFVTGINDENKRNEITERLTELRKKASENII